MSLNIVTQSALSQEHPSRSYVQTIVKMLHSSGNPDLHRKYWRKLLKMGWEIDGKHLWVSKSVEMAGKYDCKVGACYYNAARIVLDNPLLYDYVEGIATSIIPTEHAWVVDKIWGKVIDPTWIGLHQRARKPEHKIKDYFGARIPVELLRKTMKDQAYWGSVLLLVLDQIKPPPRSKPLREINAKD